MNVITPNNVPHTADRFVIITESDLQRLRQCNAELITAMHDVAGHVKTQAQLLKAHGFKEQASKAYDAQRKVLTKATALGKSQYALKHQALCNAEVVQYFNAAGISLVQTSTLQLDQAQINRSQAWIKVCELLDELDPDWFRKDGTGLDLALNSIRSLATKGKESA